MAQGLTALDPRTAAASKFVEEKIQKGELQPNQVADFLLQMGADPRLASLVFKYQKVEQAAKNQAQGQPSTTTVDQDVSNRYAQLKQQQRGLAGMAAPNLAAAPMTGGITGQPVQNAAGGGLMRLAGGGPIAFANGGRPPRTFNVDPEGNVDIGSAGDLIPYESPVEPEKTRSPSFLRKLIRNPLLRRAGYAGIGLTALGALLGDDEEEDKKPKQGVKVEQVPEGLTDEDVRLLAAADTKSPAAAAPSAGAGMPAPPKYKRPDLSPFEKAITEAEQRVPKDRQAAFAEEMAREEGLGETKAIEARRKELAGQKEKATTSPEKKFWLAVAQAGFTASAKGARNLWETLSVGGVEGIKAYQTMKDKEAETLEKIADKELQLNSMNAAIKRGAMERGDKRYDDTRKELQSLRLQRTAQEVAITNAENTAAAANWRTMYTEAGANQRAAMTMAGKQQLQRLENQYYADIAAAQRTTDPKLKAAYLRRAADTRKAKAELERTESGYQSQEARLAAEEAVMRKAQGQSGGDDGFSDLGVE
jgi:hypothetical protein